MTGRTAARVAAGISTAVMLFNVAILLGAPWDFRTQLLISQGRPVGTERGLWNVVYLVGVVVWALFALAYLARGGEGPLRAAPRGLVAAIGWFATLTAGFEIWNALTLQPVTWRVGSALVNAALFGFGLVAMLKTRAGPSQPDTSAPPVQGPNTTSSDPRH